LVPDRTGVYDKLKDFRVVAACDLDANHLRDAVNSIDGHYNNKDCRLDHDYREIREYPPLWVLTVLS
jgi:uncharacterized ParB-like nuclease family protein